MGKKALLLAGLLISSFAFADTKYIDDTMYAPLRSGQGLEFRIVHKGVKSGTPVEHLQTNAESGYSLIRTPEGIEGWLPTRFLINEPVARDKLNRMTQQYTALQQKFNDLQNEYSQIKGENSNLGGAREQLEKSNKELQLELSNIKRISENAIALDTRNRELRESNEKLKNEVELLSAENLRLKDSDERDKMLLGGGLVLLGVIIALIVPMFKREKKAGW
ncbi:MULTISPECIES: TIGR04211 family SH3 domain-containing protein [unclassified Hahella]|uniref:TIGR04211 family SH3 domain-containing protein n=1 Tax=unclassified Hahella TaxID=2624107 RepID=UPI001C1F032D|nr:TIGR04211 family SH3 domain-containing protein [Hahella sp. CR1]MBU6954353.1 TIGR04211 family SH3 domain-containing protein [Hahella sp. HN01]MDG9667472.1 TIGR04211 family SH3 domain-containing protein [Hahella sp. CR1]